MKGETQYKTLDKNNPLNQRFSLWKIGPKIGEHILQHCFVKLAYFRGVIDKPFHSDHTQRKMCLIVYIFVLFLTLQLQVSCLFRTIFFKTGVVWIL